MKTFSFILLAVLFLWAGIAGADETECHVCGKAIHLCENQLGYSMELEFGDTTLPAYYPGECKNITFDFPQHYICDVCKELFQPIATTVVEIFYEEAREGMKEIRENNQIINQLRKLEEAEDRFKELQAEIKALRDARPDK